MDDMKRLQNDDANRRKWKYLSGYADSKVRLVMLCERRDEFRDLKRISEDLGVPPGGSMPGDPTGNTAARLLDSMETVNVDISRTLAKLEEINAYIDSAPGEVDRFILTLKFIRCRPYITIANALSARTGNEMTYSSLKRRLYRIIENLPEPR